MMLHAAETFKELVRNLAELSVNFMELLSIVIIVVTTFVAFFKLCKGESAAKVYLLHGQSIGLSFKLGSEILRTITVRNMNEIMEIAMLIVIKAAMTWLIHWELKDVDPDEKTEDQQKLSFMDKIAHAMHPVTTVVINTDRKADVKIGEEGEK